MATNATVPMFAPDGSTTGEIPQSKVQDALKAGFKPAYEMTSPDGKVGYIPQEHAQDAVKAGFKLGAPDQTDHPANRFWEALTNPVGSGGREQGLLGGALQVGGQAIKTIADTVRHPIDAVTSVAKPLIASGGNPYVFGAELVKPMVENFQNDQQQRGTALAAENAAGQVLGTVEGGRALGGAAKAAAPYAAAATDAVTSKISPTALKASGAQLLKAAARDANSVPVSLDNTAEHALNLMDWQKTTNLGPSINKFLNRITKPNADPLTYQEARKFSQILGGLSADENLKLPPAVKFDLTKLVVGLKADIGAAADQVGQAANYYQGLGDYAKGKRLEGWYNFAKDQLAKTAIKGAAGAAGAGAAGAIGYEIYKNRQ